MLSVDLVDPHRRPRSILLYALIPPVAILFHELVWILLGFLLRGGAAPIDMEVHLLATLLAVCFSIAIGGAIVARSSRPFFDLTAATRAVAADPSLGPTAIPITGQTESIALAREIRALIVAHSTARAEHEGLLRVLDRGPIGLLWVAAGSATIRYLNPAWCRLVGWPPPPVCLGHRSSEIDPDGVATVGTEGRARLATGEIWSVRRILPGTDGPRWLDFTAVPLPGDGVDGPSILVFVEDLTSQAERDELRERHAEADAALPGLAASVAASRGLLELALRDPLLPGALRADLGAIRDGTAEAARLLTPLRGRASA